jgi:drug/metabolite transporter (DMT)-like permease
MKYYLYAIVSGFLLGLGSILIKYVLGIDSILVVLNPIFVLGVALYFISFLFNQIALKNMKSSIVSLFSIVTMTIVSLIGGNILGEIINLYEIAGIFLMTCSIFIILANK